MKRIKQNLRSNLFWSVLKGIPIIQYLQIYKAYIFTQYLSLRRNFSLCSFLSSIKIINRVPGQVS
ncbi:hypothetical protein ES705_45080 [subsurface metagenome]